MSTNNDTTQSDFNKNLREAIKTFITMAVLIFILVLSFYVLAIVFPGPNVIMEPSAFVFGYIIAIPFMFVISLYPFGKK